MGKTKDLGHLAHIVTYDASNNITLPANLTVLGTITGYATTASLSSYATQSYVSTQISNLVASAPATLDTLNELATALGNDPNFATTIATSIGTKVPSTRTITINGTAYDLSADRSWNITSMIYPAAGIPLSTGTAWGTSITNNSANWNTAYGWGNHATAGYLTGITSTQVTNALGYTPYNGATNPNGYITGVTNITGYAAMLNTSDTRTISPSSHTAYRLTFGFTSWSNNNTADWADYLHLRSYGDGSGGADNLVMFKKNGIGMRIWQQAFGSATAYSSYVDVIHSGNYTSYAVPTTRTITINGTAYDLSANREWTVTASETDTLATVTGRGASTSTAISINNTLTVTSGRVIIRTGGVNTYGIVSGYDNNNHLMTMRGQISGATSSPTISGGHQMTFVEYAEANDTTGWFFKSSSSGTYEEIARITRSTFNYSGNTVIHSGNIGSYTAGAANSVSWSNVSSKPSDIMYYAGFTLDANTMPSNSTGFTYSVNAPLTGPIVKFSTGGGYDLQINAPYYWGNEMYFRVRNGDLGIWRGWKQLLNAESHTYAANMNQYVRTSDNVSFNTVSTAYLSVNQSNGPVAEFRKSGSAPGNNVTMRVVNTYGNHSWGITGEFRVENNSGTDRPSILFSNGYDSNTWTVGYGYADSGYFRINRDHGYVNGSWGVTLMSMDRSGNVTFSGDVTAYSDIRLKDNIQTIENAIEKIKKIRGVTFTRNDEIEKSKGRRHAGVIAQEVLEVLPEVISLDDKGVYYNVSYGNMAGLFIEAIKEQQYQIEELKSILNALTK